MNCKIPKLLLQPIVENAILHGIEPNHAPGELKIICSDVDDDLEIIITDNGVGMSQDEIDRIFSQTKGQSFSRFTGIGVRNVDERLKLYYGPRYGLEISSEPGKGTAVKLALPKIV